MNDPISEFIYNLIAFNFMIYVTCAVLLLWNECTVYRARDAYFYVTQQKERRPTKMHINNEMAAI